MVTSSYCSIYTRYIDYTSLPFKRNENDIANKNTYKTNHYQHWIRIEPSKQPYLFFCLWYTKDFILWMRRINVIGYTNLFRICFSLQYVMISCVHYFYTKLGDVTFFGRMIYTYIFKNIHNMYGRISGVCFSHPE